MVLFYFVLNFVSNFAKMNMDIPASAATSSSTYLPDEKEQDILLSEASYETDADTRYCPICLKKIKFADMSEVKGCWHAYCINCILQWASSSPELQCPQCKQQFSTLFLYKNLDGSLHDYMIEESVCLLLRAWWYKPVPDYCGYGSEEEVSEEFDNLQNKQNVTGDDMDSRARGSGKKRESKVAGKRQTLKTEKKPGLGKETSREENFTVYND